MSASSSPSPKTKGTKRRHFESESDALSAYITRNLQGRSDGQRTCDVKQLRVRLRKAKKARVEAMERKIAFQAAKAAADALEQEKFAEMQAAWDSLSAATKARHKALDAFGTLKSHHGLRGNADAALVAENAYFANMIESILARTSIVTGQGYSIATGVGVPSGKEAVVVSAFPYGDEMCGIPAVGKYYESERFGMIKVLRHLA